VSDTLLSKASFFATELSERFLHQFDLSTYGVSVHSHHLIDDFVTLVLPYTLQFIKRFQICEKKRRAAKYMNNTSTLDEGLVDNILDILKVSGSILGRVNATKHLLEPTLSLFEFQDNFILQKRLLSTSFASNYIQNFGTLVFSNHLLSHSLPVDVHQGYESFLDNLLPYYLEGLKRNDKNHAFLDNGLPLEQEKMIRIQSSETILYISQQLGDISSVTYVLLPLLDLFSKSSPLLDTSIIC